MGAGSWHMQQTSMRARVGYQKVLAEAGRNVRRDKDEEKRSTGRQRNNYAVAIQTHTAFRKTATAPRYSLICVLPKLYLFSTSAYYRCTGGERSEGREEEEEEEKKKRIS